MKTLPLVGMTVTRTLSCSEIRLSRSPHELSPTPPGFQVREALTFPDAAPRVVYAAEQFAPPRGFADTGIDTAQAPTASTAPIAAVGSTVLSGAIVTPIFTVTALAAQSRLGDCQEA